jgi:hypothetical protein
MLPEGTGQVYNDLALEITTMTYTLACDYRVLYSVPSEGSDANSINYQLGH